MLQVFKRVKVNNILKAKNNYKSYQQEDNSNCGLSVALDSYSFPVLDNEIHIL